MRLLFPVAMAIATTASAQAAPEPSSPLQRPALVAGSDCPSATREFARKGGIWRQEPVRPKKLAELPPADTYAAVYRLDERGCMVPVKYRDVRFIQPPGQR